MSVAWEVTVEDVAQVLARCDVADDPSRVFDQHFAGDAENCFRVERAALAYTEFDEQCESAFDEIEAILTEVGVIPS